MDAIKNIELEYTVLSSLLLDPNCLDMIELLKNEDFFLKKNKLIFYAIRELKSKGKNVDHVMLYNYLKGKITFEDLKRLNNVMPNTAYFEDYVKDLKKIKQKRKLFYLTQEIQKKIAKGENPIDYAEKNILKVRDLDFEKEENEVDVLDRVIKNIDSRLENPNKIIGLETGFKQLDYMLDGLHKKDYIVLAARPSMGKTALAMNIVQDVSKRGKKSIFFILEGTKEKLLNRMILSEAKISSYEIRKAGASNLNKDIIKKKIDIAKQTVLKNIPKIVEKPGISIEEIKATSRKHKKDHGLDLIVIDYLQLIKAIGNSRFEQVTNISMGIRELCKELDCPVLALAQLNRANETRPNKRPNMADLRESGQIEQDADVIMFIHRQEYYDIRAGKESSDPGGAEIIIAKNKEGKVGTIKLGFLEECITFVDYNELSNYECPF